MAGIIISTEFEMPGLRRGGHKGFLGYVDKEAKKENWHLKNEDAGEELTDALQQGLHEVEGWDAPEGGAAWQRNARQEEKQAGLAERYYDSFLDYMDREGAGGAGEAPNTVRMFGKDVERFSEAGKEEAARIFGLAEKKGSPLWKTVISFETAWLRDMGIYDGARRDVDDHRLIQCARQSMAALLKEEGFETAYWAGEIHKDKAHFHVHFGIVDPDPSWKEGAGRCRAWPSDGVAEYKAAGGGRVSVPHNAGELYQKGVFKNSSHEAAKSAFVSYAAKTADASKRLDALMREDIIGKLKANPLAASRFEGAFLALAGELPENKGLWKYGMNAMAPYRERIDEISRLFIEENCKGEYAQFEALLARQDRLYSAAYGNAGRSYADGKREDLFKRMGNTILAEARNPHFRSRTEKNAEAPLQGIGLRQQAQGHGEPWPARPPAGGGPPQPRSAAKLKAKLASKRHGSAGGGGARLRGAPPRNDIDAAFFALKRLLKDDMKTARNMAAYERLRRQEEGMEA